MIAIIEPEDRELIEELNPGSVIFGLIIGGVISSKGGVVD